MQETVWASPLHEVLQREYVPWGFLPIEIVQGIVFILCEIIMCESIMSRMNTV